MVIDIFRIPKKADLRYKGVGFLEDDPHAETLRELVYKILALIS